MKLIALRGGGDWSDASLDLLSIPDGMDLEKEKSDWHAWYEGYCDEWRTWYEVDGDKPSYIPFADWLKQRGARDAREDEIETAWAP